MKSLVVYCLDGKWFGEEATYKRSGSGLLQGVHPHRHPPIEG